MRNLDEYRKWQREFLIVTALKIYYLIIGLILLAVTCCGAHLWLRVSIMLSIMIPFNFILAWPYAISDREPAMKSIVQLLAIPYFVYMSANMFSILGWSDLPALGLPVAAGIIWACMVPLYPYASSALFAKSAQR